LVLDAEDPGGGHFGTAAAIPQNVKQIDYINLMKNNGCGLSSAWYAVDPHDPRVLRQ
jgi:hypothetical protein